MMRYNQQFPLIIFAVILVQCTKAIEIKFKTPIQNNVTFIPEIPICFGTPPQCFNYILDLTSSITLVPCSLVKDKFKSFFDQTASSSYKDTYTSLTINYQNHLFYSHAINDEISFPAKPNNALSIVTLALINEQKDSGNLKEIEGILGLSKYYFEVNDITDLNDNAWSLIHRLKKNNVISNKLFSITYSEDGQGFLYLGEKPKQFTSQIEIGVCETSLNINEWNCPFNFVTLSKKQVIVSTDTIKPHVIFNTSTKWVIGPLSQGQIIFDNYIALSKDKCKTITEATYSSLICDSDLDLKTIPNLVFVLDEKSNRGITFKSNEMFRLVQTAKGKNYKSNWFLSPEASNWDIGMIVLKNHDMLFDYEENKVTFTNKTEEEKGSLLWLYITLGIICFILIGIGAGVGIWFWKKKTNKSTEDYTTSFLKGDILSQDINEGNGIRDNKLLADDDKDEEHTDRVQSSEVKEEETNNKEDNNDNSKEEEEENDDKEEGEEK